MRWWLGTPPRFQCIMNIWIQICLLPTFFVGSNITSVRGRKYSWDTFCAGESIFDFEAIFVGNKPGLMTAKSLER